MTKTIIAVALLSLSSIAAANCGNNKPVGNGCTTTPDVVSAPNVTVSTGSVNNSTSFNPTNTFNPSVGVGVSNSNSNTFNPTNQVGVGVDVGVRNNNTNNNNVSNINANYNNARSDSLSLSNSASNSTSLSNSNSTSNATVGNVAGGSASASVGNVSGGNASVSSQNSAQGGAGGQAYNTLTYTVQEAQRPVSSAVAPTIFHSGGQDTCMGSSSASVQGMSLGVAVGSTWTDKHCEALRASVRLNELGLKRTAMARLCAIPEIAEAFAISGEFSCNKQ